MRLSVSSVVVRCVLGALVLLLFAACQSDETKLAQFWERGRAYVEEGKLEEAVIEFKNVLKLDPNDASAHHELAKAYLELRKVREAFWELSETVRLDPGNKEARLTLGGLALVAKDYEEALAQSEGALEIDPQDVDAHLLRAQALARLERPEEAEAAYLKAVELDPERGASLSLLASYYISVDNLEAAESTLIRCTEVDPGFLSYTNLGRFLATRTERAEEAEAAFKSALQHADAEKRGNAYKNLATLYAREQRFDDAVSIMERGIEEADPGSDERLDLIYGLVRFYRYTGQPDKADALIESTTADQPDSARPYLILSTYRASKGDLEGALQAAVEAVAAEPDNSAAVLRKAEVLADIGYREGEKTRVAEALHIVEGVLEDEPSSPAALFVLGKIRLAEGDSAAAVEALQKAVDGRDDWAEARFVLGSALMLKDELAGARVELARAVELDPELLEARGMLAKLHSSLGEYEYAIEQAKECLSRNPDDTEMRVLMAQGLLRLGRAEEAVKQLESVPDEERGLEVVFALGRIYLAQRRWEEARKFLLRANELSPNQHQILTSLTQLDYAMGKADEADARLEAAVKADPDNAELVLLQGSAALRRRDPKTAEASFKRAIELDANLLEAYQQLAALYHAQGRLDETIATYEAAIEAQPRSAKLHQFLAVLYEMSGNVDKAIEHYESAIELDSGLGQAKNNLAYLLAEQERSLDRALDLAQDAKALMPDSANAADTLGWVLFKRGMYSAAIGYLKEAVANSPPEQLERGLIRHHLAQAYEADKQPAKAVEVLEQLLSELEKRMAESRAQGQTPREPQWSVQARSMLERLKAAG